MTQILYMEHPLSVLRKQELRRQIRFFFLLFSLEKLAQGLEVFILVQCKRKHEPVVNTKIGTL